MATKYYASQDGSVSGKMECVLIVYRDIWNGNGKSWRLAWENVDNPNIMVHDESDVTGNPYFRTMKDAINKGIKKYNIIAKKRIF